MTAAALPRRFGGPWAAMGLTIPALLACAAVFATSQHDRLDDPLTLALAACAIYASLAYVDMEETFFVDASLIPLLLTAVFLGPAPTIAVAIVAEASAWITQRYRASAALINLASTTVPSVVVSVAFSTVPTESSLEFYVLVIAGAVAAYGVNVAILMTLIGILDGQSIFRPEHPRQALPAVFLNVALTVAAAHVYVSTGLAAVIVILILIFGFNYLVAQVFTARKQADEIAALAASRGQLVAQALAAEERERRALADALHDGPIQQLLVASQDLTELSGADSSLATPLSKNMISVVDQLRRVVFELHPAILDRSGLEAAVRTLARDQSERGRFSAEVTISDDVPGQHERLVYSVVRELLRNAAKHANARRVSVRIGVRNEVVEIEVEDDGRGLCAGDVNAAVEAGHIGLASIDERVRALGGSVDVDGRSGEGTRVRVLVPLAP